MENLDVIHYMNQLDDKSKDRIEKIRHLVKTILVNSNEIISYGIITYKQKKNLFHIGGYQHHIGIYPGPKMIIKYQEELKSYKTSKGTFQIQHHQDIPFDLIKTMLLDISNDIR